MKIFRFFFVFLAMIVVSSMVLLNCKSKSSPGSEDTSMTEKLGPNQLTQAEIDEGWVLLFDGETTKGWRGYGLMAFPDSGWTVKDGNLICLHSGTGEAGAGGDVLYDKKLTNFHLKLEWMIEEGGNSGIFLLGEESDEHAIWYTAPEYQILDNDGPHIDNELGENGNRRAGSLYDMIPSDTALYKGAMEWHSAEIISYEGTIVFKLDGTTTMEFHLWTQEWEEMVAKSKFPGINPDFANVPKTGYIGLQDHGHAVWFRNMKIKEM